MVTASHNPPGENGFKLLLGAERVHGAGLKALVAAEPTRGAGGSASEADVTEAYVARLVQAAGEARPLRVAWDCGNGATGPVVERLTAALPGTHALLHARVDGRFPNHHPDPAHPENLQDLIRVVRDTDAELGLAFDGDGDRLGVVTKDGQIVFPDRQIMLFAKDILAANPGGEIIFDVKCTRRLAPWIREHGGRPTMWRTGHSLIKAKLKETGAPFAGEMSGHLFFNDRWPGFDDGIYAGARLLEILSRSSDPSAVLNALPSAISTPELHLPTAEGENFALVERLKTDGRFEGAEQLITIDGVRAEWSDGFGLARPSNTTPVVVLRFEGDTPEALARIKTAFRTAILQVAPQARLPF
jgi:phosphomannomutase/phosphoglucomutase